MGSKRFIFMLIGVVAGAAGCANAQRFLPGGVIKVKDLEKGRPVNPDLADEIAERERKGRKSPFPILSAQPSTPPTAMSKAERRADQRGLLAKRARLETDLASDRAKAAAERVEPAGEAKGDVDDARTGQPAAMAVPSDTSSDPEHDEK